MIRRIVKIDQERCDGCGLCVTACHEGAIVLVADKAALLRDDYCDGLGDCLPACPQQAISFEEREALPYDEAAVLASQSGRAPASLTAFPGACPGAQSGIVRDNALLPPSFSANKETSMLRQWPVQLHLVPVQASFFRDAHLLVAADCCAYVHAGFHADFMRGRVTLIGCPKLDPVDYTEKLTEILRHNSIRSLTLTRMSVPCCGGLEQALARALGSCGKNIPLRIYTLAKEGNILEEKQESD